MRVAEGFGGRRGGEATLGQGCVVPHFVCHCVLPAVACCYVIVCCLPPAHCLLSGHARRCIAQLAAIEDHAGAGQVVGSREVMDLLVVGVRVGERVKSERRV